MPGQMLLEMFVELKRVSTLDAIESVVLFGRGREEFRQRDQFRGEF